MSDGKTYEMLWDCQFCGTKGNLGLTHRFCPSCGAPQNPDSRYYPSDEDKIEVQNHQYVGVDVTCPACNELNSAASEFCGQCGSPLTEGARAKTLDEQSRGDYNAFASSGSRDVVKEKFDAEMERVGVIPSKKKRKGGLNPTVIAIIAAVVVVIGGLIFLFTSKTEGELLVTGHEWERSIDVQEYRSFSINDWHDRQPSGFNVRQGRCWQEQRSTERIQQGETCETVRRDQGDGTYREERVCSPNYVERPINDRMCTWTGERWESTQPIVASGDLDNAPAWPAVNLNCEGQRRIGCEQESGRTENYWVLYEDADDKDYRCNFSQNEWESIRVESVWIAQVGRFVTSIDCDTLQPK